MCIVLLLLSLIHTHAHKNSNTNTGTLVFAISDGAVPGSNGRNYVLRRVLRRAVRFGQQQLGIEPGFMAKLVNTVVSHMKSAFPEIEAREKYVVEVIRKEEETFNRTVKKGIRKFKQVTSKMKPGDVLSGEDAYKLWSTFGFPKELTELMIEEVKMKMCTEESWEKAYKAQQEISRSGQKAADLTGMKLEANETLALEKQGVQPTDCTAKYVMFECEVL
jgi:alanyl-tRNA synthetase